MTDTESTSRPREYRGVKLRDITQVVNNVHYREEITVFRLCGNILPEVLPLRVESLLICLCKAGELRLSIDLKEYTLELDSLLVLHPNSFMTSIEASDDCEMTVVACSRNVVENIVPKLTDLLPLMLETRVDNLVRLSPGEAHALEGWFSGLYRLLDTPDSPFKRPKMLCMLQGLLYEMMDMHHTRAQAAPVMRKSRREEIMARFLLAVTENFRHERHVTFYADLLCITPKHLSAVVKGISGRTAGDWIDSYVIMEAKVMLLSTDCTIQEIAAKLNFANQSFFGKYFKHLTGISPSEYRKANS
ncbi:MAG: helix-turn-helix domain-containing protein [Muribaculaceae bacterium]|nr:helix-turn-helix domain-containing protein [Muribaculaceae bacterium]